MNAHSDEQRLPYHWTSNPIAWGLSIGTTLAQIVIVVALWCLTRSQLLTCVVGAILFVFCGFVSFDVVRSKDMNDHLKKGVDVAGAFVICLVFGLYMPIFIAKSLPGAVRRSRERYKADAERGASRREAFFTLPESIASRATSSMSANYFEDTSSTSYNDFVGPRR
jgi:hypothetical protein